jgi:hypothetical protein
MGLGLRNLLGGESNWPCHADTLFLVSIELNSAYSHLESRRASVQEEARYGNGDKECDMKPVKRTVLITGGTSRIGLELARQLLQRGDVVIVTGCAQHRLDVTTAALPRGPQVSERRERSRDNRVAAGACPLTTESQRRVRPRKGGSSWALNLSESETETSVLERS